MKKITTAVLILILTLTGCATICASVLPAAVKAAEAAVRTAQAAVETDRSEEALARLAAAYAMRTAARLAYERACQGLMAVGAVGITLDGQRVTLISEDPLVYEVDGERRAFADELAAFEEGAP